MKVLGKKISYSTLILVLILVLGAILRFYRLPDMAYFDFDQEYAANFAYSVLHNHQKLLIGQGLSIQGLFMGPWYFYFLVPFFALTNLHPLGGFIGSVLLGLSIVWAYYFVASRLFSKEAGLITSFLASISYSRIENDWSMVPSYSSTLLVLFGWYFFYNYCKGKTEVFPFIGLLFGLFTSIHPILFPFYFVFIALLLIYRRLPNGKTALLGLAAFIFPLLPLLLFEYWHRFLEVKELLALFTGQKAAEGKTLSVLFDYLRVNFTTPSQALGTLYIPQEIFGMLIFILGVILIVRGIGFWKDKFHTIGIITAFVIVIGYYTLYPAHVPEYYFLSLSTLVFLYFGASLSLLLTPKAGKIVLSAILLFLTFSNLSQVYNKWQNPSLTTLSHKDAIVKEILKKQPQSQKFYISYIAAPGWNNGFDYLFKVYKRTPQRDVAGPPIYTIVTPKTLSIDSIGFASGNIGVIWPEN